MPNTIRFDQGLPSIERSSELLRRATGLIPSFSQTLAKGPTQYVRGVAPVYLERGAGSHVWDVDGNEYIDMTMAVGPLSLGYAYPRVDAAIKKQLEHGITFSLMHPLEVEVAELIRAAVPGAEMVRYSKTGADVTSAAVRLSRAFTGRDRVVCSGYHGWHDWYVGTTARSHGVPSATRELTQTFKHNDAKALQEALDDRVACVILEPVLFEPLGEDYLQAVRRACTQAGALLIFDEMWTGFRLELGGAQERYDVKADLACFSKAVANGMPLAVLTGREDVMRLLEDDVFFYTTFGGEALSLAAAEATVRELREQRVPANLKLRGGHLQAGYNQLARERGLEFTRAIGPECRTLIQFDASAGDPLLQKSLVQQEMLRHGVLWGGFHNLSFSHGDAEIAHVLGAYARALDVLAEATKQGDLASRIKGTPVQPVFRKTV
ncbi:MAG TPA: aminotransferase class III-fold pyridoxal phosphate-dependent enzyme [Polyangiaceae bacterium]|nr:aminotransferase class III-fold pyridoxal phosphate-dependent enzyme [Polyangiaceae bacterium]